MGRHRGPRKFPHTQHNPYPPQRQYSQQSSDPQQGSYQQQGQYPQQGQYHQQGQYSQQYDQGHPYQGRRPSKNLPSDIRPPKPGKSNFKNDQHKRRHSNHNALVGPQNRNDEQFQPRRPSLRRQHYNGDSPPTHPTYQAQIEQSQPKRESKYENNQFVSKLREQKDAFKQAHSRAETGFFQPPTPDRPKFGFERDWTQDQFVIKFLSSALELSALHRRILRFPEFEQQGVLRYLFTSDIPIPIGKYTRDGVFEVAHQLNDVVQGEDRLARMIATTFYANNTFLFETHLELITFVMSTPQASLNLITSIVLGSNVIRRSPPRARDVAHRNRTQEDLDVEAALQRIPKLENVLALLGYDIDDLHHRHVIGTDWCDKHPNLPVLKVLRLKNETLPGYAGDRSTMEAEDSEFFNRLEVSMKSLREMRSNMMEITIT